MTISLSNYIIEGEGIRLSASNKLLTREELLAMSMAVKDGKLVSLAGRSDPFEQLIAALQLLAEAARKRDADAVVRGFGPLSGAVDRVAGVQTVLDPDKDGAVTLEDLPAAIRAGAKTYRSSPGVQGMDLPIDPATMESNAGLVERCQLLSQAHQGGLQRINDFITPRARDMVDDLRTVHKLTTPHLCPGSETEREAAPMVRYFAEPVERAQKTKDHLDKAREVIAQKVTEQAETRGREQARKELSDKFNDALKGLIEKPE